jgi:hypothetical protein
MVVWKIFEWSVLNLDQVKNAECARCTHQSTYVRAFTYRSTGSCCLNVPRHGNWHVRTAVLDSCTVHISGECEGGWFLSPVVLSGCTDNMRVVRYGTMQESGEQCTVVFAWIVTVRNQLAAERSVTINEKKIVHFVLQAPPGQVRHVNLYSQSNQTCPLFRIF